MASEARMLLLLAVLPTLAAAQEWPQFEPSVDALTVKNGEVEVRVVLNPGARKATKPFFVGLSFRKPRDGEWLDVPYVTVAPKDAGKPVVFKAKLGPGFVEYVVGVWGSECDDRLCDPLAGVPAGAFGENGETSWGDATWAPLVDVPLRVRLLDAGGGPAAVKAVRAKLDAALGKQPFKVVDGGKAQKPRTGVEVLVRDAAHVGFARAVSSDLKAPAPTGWPDAPDAIVIAVGK
jgi:hypothetical protein